MNPRARRLLAVGAGACLALSVGVAGQAAADTQPDDVRGWGLTLDQRGDEQLVASVESARSRFRTAVQTTRSNLRTTLEGIRLDIAEETTAQRTANRALHEREVLMAVATARSSLQSARALYLASIATAFDAYAPGVTVPRALLETASWSGIGDGSWLDPLGLRTP